MPGGKHDDECPYDRGKTRLKRGWLAADGARAQERTREWKQAGLSFPPRNFIEVEKSKP
jgi:hypothetical protein